MKEYYNENNGDNGFNDWNHTETLTVVYHSIPQEIKDDFYNNKFDGEVSKFFMQGDVIICGVLSEPVERMSSSGEVVKGVRIYGITITKTDTKMSNL